ncbi:MAG: leucyl aminopeptidase, partial [Sphingomonadaceae bacterium]
MRILFNPADHRPDALVTLLGKGEAAPEALAPALAAARFDGETAAVVEILGAPGAAAPRLLVVGTGAADARDAAAFERIGGAVSARLIASGARSVAIDMAGISGKVGAAQAAAHVALGAVLRGYRFDRYRTRLPEKKKATLEEVAIINADAGAGEAFAPLAAAARGVGFARDLVTEPANVVYPESFVERAKAELGPLGVGVEVLDEAAMRELGMGALLGVAQGSARPPRLLVLRWDGTGGRAATPQAALVGKGVTFDTGGISIKPAQGMEDMKYDMAGAAAVTGAFAAIAGRRAAAHVVGVCALVENMPSGTAQRPGDVVTAASGQTIEVLNTDAEGRLILADAVWYAQEKLGATTVVDLATLTGAMVIALGNEFAGLFANDDTLAAQLLAAAEVSGDRLWRMPLAENYDKQIDSPIADVKNISGGREAGSAMGAHFIGRFIREGVKWAHLDIAGMVWASKDQPLTPKGATGYGVR